MRKTETIRSQLGSAGQVLGERIHKRLSSTGITRQSAAALAREIETEDGDAFVRRARRDMADEEEKRLARLSRELGVLDRELKDARERVAIRVYPHMSGDVRFSLRDGKTDWEKSFGLMGADESFQFVVRGTYDGWAVYQLHDRDGPARFSVQYMFGDVNPAPHDCLVLPPHPEPVTVFEMAPVAVQMYLERLTGDGSGTPDQMRRRLLAAVNPAEAAPSQPAPAAAQAAPAIANACGVPVIAALVEIGSRQPPKVFSPESINGRMEFNYLSEAGDEPLSVMCFRTKEQSSLFRVPLPAGLTRCWFENGALSCSADAVAGAGQVAAAEPAPEPEPEPADRANTLSYGSRAGMVVTVMKKSGIGTTHAKITTKLTWKDAMAYCREYVGEVTTKCVADGMKVKLRPEITANCKTGKFTTLGGQGYRFLGRNPAYDGTGMDAEYLLVEAGSKKPLDGSMVSGYATALGQFEALCPNRVK